MFTHAQNWNIGTSYVAEAETMSSYLAFYEVVCLSHLPSVSNFYSTLEIYNMPLDRSPDSQLLSFCCKRSAKKHFLIPSCQIISNTDIVEGIYFLSWICLKYFSWILKKSKLALLDISFDGNCQYTRRRYFAIMFGGLNVEMTAFKVLGKWLSGSG